MEIAQSHSASQCPGWGLSFDIFHLTYGLTAILLHCFCHALHELIQEKAVGGRIQRLRSRERLVVGLYFYFSFSKGP